MPVIKTRFHIKTEDFDRINEAISRCGKSSERAINNYLHNEAGKNIAESITKYIPRSNRNKVHAQDSKWYDQDNFNLAVGISNSLKGTRGNSFYYLYYVATGTGNSDKKGPNDFMEKGLEEKYDNVVNGIIQKLLENIDKELK